MLPCCLIIERLSMPIISLSGKAEAMSRIASVSFSGWLYVGTRTAPLRMRKLAYVAGNCSTLDPSHRMSLDSRPSTLDPSHRMSLDPRPSTLDPSHRMSLDPRPSTLDSSHRMSLDSRPSTLDHICSGIGSSMSLYGFPSSVRNCSSCWRIVSSLLYSMVSLGAMRTIVSICPSVSSPSIGSASSHTIRSA